jgi:hypothetical protein
MSPATTHEIGQTTIVYDLSIDLDGITIEMQKVATP